MSAPGRARVIVLHGALGAAASMRPLVGALQPHADVRALDMLGHAGRPVPRRLSVKDLAEDAIAQAGEQSDSPAFIFGYSAGACVALYLARYFARHFAGVCTLAAKYVFDRRTIAHWTYLTDPERLKRPELKRAPVLADLHRPQDWVAVALANRRMFQEWERRPPLTPDELRGISLPALMFCSDDDQLVSADEARALGALVPKSRVVFFRGQSHPLDVVPVAAIAKAIADWIGAIVPA